MPRRHRHANSQFADTCGLHTNAVAGRNSGLTGHETSHCNRSLRIEPDRVLKHAKLDAADYNPAGASRNHHAVRVRTGRRRSADVIRAILPDPVLRYGGGQ
jgi:hypothetical protein